MNIDEAVKEIEKITYYNVIPNEGQLRDILKQLEPSNSQKMSDIQSLISALPFVNEEQERLLILQSILNLSKK